MTDLQKFIAVCEAQTEAIEQYLEVLIDFKDKVVCAQPAGGYLSELILYWVTICNDSTTPDWLRCAIHDLLVKAREEGLK